MQQYLTYFCTYINETGPSLVIFLRVDQFYVLRFLFCRVYFAYTRPIVSSVDKTIGHLVCLFLSFVELVVFKCVGWVSG